jgi:leader peptidase (prepilin peptidase) / N-methyltransferase
LAVEPVLVLTLVFAFLLGSLIGSFSNVLIYRIPRGESIAFPASHCTKCGHQLGVLDLFPFFSWLFLRGRCRYCGAPISVRYPIVELISGLGYVAVAYFFSPIIAPITTIGFWLLFTILLAVSAIDIETYTIPDILTYIGLAGGIIVAASRQAGETLPDLTSAIQGAGLGAGLLGLIAGLGAWVLRRFREPQHPDYPIGYMQMHLAALVGAWLGPIWGVAAAGVSVGMNIVSKKLVPIPDFLTLGGLLLSLVALAQGIGPGIITGLQNALIAMGLSALAAGFYWAFLDKNIEDPDAPYDPVAMGFGDVKLMGVLGAFLGWQMLLLGLGISVVLGAVIGIIGRVAGGQRQIPFGPYLAAGALAALVIGPGPLQAYLRSVGL